MSFSSTILGCPYDSIICLISKYYSTWFLLKKKIRSRVSLRSGFIVEEKETWISKQIAEDHFFAKKYKKQILNFKSANYRERTIFEIRNNNNRREAILNVIKTQFTDWRDWLLLLICFTPFSQYLLSYIFKRKTKLI